MHIVLAISTAFTLWMMVDAIQKGIACRWAFVIMIPFGEFAYFFAVKIHDFKGGGAGPAHLVGGRSSWHIFQGFRAAPPTIDDLRYELEQSPCIENHMKLARALYDEGNHRETLVELEQILKLDDRDPETHYGMARCHLALSEFEPAERHFREVISLHRSYQDYAAWEDLANVLQQNGRGDEAVEVLRDLHRTCPRLDHGVQLAQLLFDRNQFEEASNELKRALRDYDHAPAHVQRTNKQQAHAAHRLLAQMT